MTGGYFNFLFLSLSNAEREAALFWWCGLHVNWETSQFLGEGRSVLAQVKREKEETTQANISREKETRWVFPELAESNPLEKRNI